MLHQYWVMEMIVQDRLETLRAEAESAQFQPETAIPRTRLYRRTIVGIGASLIKAGTFLEHRYAPIAYEPPETDCAPC